MLAEPGVRPAKKKPKKLPSQDPPILVIATHPPKVCQAVAHLTPPTIPKTKFSGTSFIPPTDKEHPVGARLLA